MSGQPNEFEVKELLDHIDEIRSNSRRIATLKREIKTAQDEIDNLEPEVRAGIDAVNTLLKRMDVYAAGNFGHEDRRIVFLDMLVKAARGVS